MTVSAEAMLAVDQADAQRSLFDFPLFCKRYLTTDEGDPLDMGDVHLRILKEIELARSERKDLCLLGPMQSAKTKYWAIAYALWLLVRSKVLQLGVVRVWVVSSNMKNAKRKLSETKDILEHNELLNKDFGPFRTGTMSEWSATAFYIEGIPFTRDPHLRATYPGGDLGGRGDFFILDDLFDQINSSTETQAEPVIEAIRKTITSRKAAKNREAMILMFGTDWGDYTAYRAIEDHDPRFGNWKFIKIAALTDQAGNAIEDLPEDITTLTSYWPQLWPVERLVELWRADPIFFLQAYQNSREALHGDVFKTFYNFDKPPVMALMTVNLGVDPAGRDGHGDYCSVCAAGWAEKRAYVLRCERVRGTKEVQAELIRRVFEEVKGFRVTERDGKVVTAPLPVSIIIEDVGEQLEALKDKEALRGLPIRGQTTGGEAKAARIRSLGPYVNNGQIMFKKDDLGVAELIMDLRRCKNYINGKPAGPKMGLTHIDRPDSLEIAVRSLLGTGTVGRVIDMGELTRNRTNVRRL